jgi:hypothetical protein
VNEAGSLGAHLYSRRTAAGEVQLEASNRTIFYLADWLPPDFGAVGQYAVLFCREMAMSGRQVRLIGLRSSNANDTKERFDRGELRITSLWSRSFRKQSSIGRLIWALRANVRLVWEVARDKNSRGADLHFTGSPPFMLFFAFLLKVFRQVRLVYRITDFYPEVLFAAWGRRPAWLAPLSAFTWFLRRRVDEFEVLGEDQRTLLIDGGVLPERISLRRDVSPIAISGNEQPAERPRALNGMKILLYSGNYGVAHEIETVARGLIWHHRHGGGQFGLWLNASGSAITPLTKRLLEAGVPFAVSDPVPLEQLPSVLAAADAHLIALRAGFAGYVLPSKIYACLNSRKPILYVGPSSSDVHLLCTRQQPKKYEHVVAGDEEGFSRALNKIASADPSYA